MSRGGERRAKLRRSARRERASTTASRSARDRRDDGPIGIYSCGPTVYDRIHVGNARPFVVAMVLKRHLDRQGVPSKVVINITDVNDKIYVAAAQRGIAQHGARAAEMTDWYIADTSRLGLGRPDVEPRVTETMPEIIALIERLIANGLAYEAHGDVYFAVERFDSYGGAVGPAAGRDAGRGPRRAGGGQALAARLRAVEGEQAGRGRLVGLALGPRPARLAHRVLGDGDERTSASSIDVHGGGLDLIFPHHENERAQSEGATGRPFAGTWLHNGLLAVRRREDVEVARQRRAARRRDRRRGARRRCCCCSRAPTTAARWTTTTTRCGRRSRRRGHPRGVPGAARCGRRRQRRCRPRRRGARRGSRAFDAALDDDLATPQAMAELFELITSHNRAVDRPDAVAARRAGGRRHVPVAPRRARPGRPTAAADEVPAEVVALAEERRCGPRGPRLRPRRRAARARSPRPASSCATRATGSSSCRLPR